MSRNTKQYASQLLDRLIELDGIASGAHYEIGRILSAIQHSKLWQTLGYESMSHLIDEELTFSSATGFTYLRCYRKLKTLQYTESESLDLLTEFGISRLSDWLSTAKQKVGKRAIANAIKAWRKEHQQINFTLSATDAGRLDEMLEKFGASKSDNGRWQGSTDAFVDILTFVEQKTMKTKLTVVK